MKEKVAVFQGQCSECPKKFYTPHPHKKTCGPECQKIRQKRLKKEAYALNPEKYRDRVRAYQETPEGQASIERNNRKRSNG